MKTKEEIVANWLPRYTKRSLNDFGEYILLTNFNKYVELFADKFNVPVLGRDANMTSAHAEGITIINFGMGSPNAAIIMDLLGAIQPKACLFLGKCGGIDRKNKLGDLILPIAAIRGEGTSNDYYPPEVPALPAFMLQRAVSSAIRDHARDYWTGTVYTFPEEVDWQELLHGLGFRTAAMALRQDSLRLSDPRLSREEKLAVVMGTEGDGLAPQTIARCDYTVMIPMTHGVDSLNVAAASAVAFYQLGLLAQE